MSAKHSKIIYLDYAAATPIDEKVLKMVISSGKHFFANPSAIHSEGVLSRESVNEARIKIASLTNTHKDEIVFTGSGTESDALAILGVVNNYRNKIEGKQIPHIITSVIEHPAVLLNFKLLEKEGKAEVTYIKVDELGFVSPKEIKDALKENTILVSIMYANNEIGTIQPIQEIAKVIRHFKKEKGKTGKHEFREHGYFSAEKFLVLEPSLSQAPLNSCFPVFHTDACQAMNYLFTENIEKLGVDLLSFNSSKIYGPKGVGVLYKKRSVELSPLYSGGGQEFGLKSGTEDVAGISGVALALEIASKMKKKESARLIKLRDYGINKLLKLSSNSSKDLNNGFQIILNGDSKNRLPNNINISISGISSELLVIELSAKGIMVSSKSACKSGDTDESYVIEALHSFSPRQDLGDLSARQDIADLAEDGSLRISLGRETKKSDIDALVSSLKLILAKYEKWK